MQSYAEMKPKLNTKEKCICLHSSYGSVSPMLSLHFHIPHGLVSNMTTGLQRERVAHGFFKIPTIDLEHKQNASIICKMNTGLWVRSLMNHLRIVPVQQSETKEAGGRPRTQGHEADNSLVAAKRCGEGWEKHAEGEYPRPWEKKDGFFLL